MSIKSIITLPDPLLRTVSRPIETIDTAIKTLAKDMLETMYHAPGIGLAAIQIGIDLRLIVLDVSEKEGEKNPLICINPEILFSSQEGSVYKEGCLSIPEYYAEIERPKTITISYIDLNGQKKERQADGLLATCLQHEIDHLHGVLFIDYLSKLRKDRVIRKFKKIEREKKLQEKIL